MIHEFKFNRIYFTSISQKAESTYRYWSWRYRWNLIVIFWSYIVEETVVPGENHWHVDNGYFVLYFYCIFIEVEGHKSVKVNLHVAPEEGYFKLNRFTPSKNNVRSQWFLGKTEENQESSGMWMSRSGHGLGEWLRPLIFSERSKSLVISPLWVRASLGSHVRQAKFCLRVVRCFFSGISILAPPNDWLGSKWMK